MLENKHNILLRNVSEINENYDYLQNNFSKLQADFTNVIENNKSFVNK